MEMIPWYILGIMDFAALPVQLLLCFKAKRLLFRLLPLASFAVLSLIFLIQSTEKSINAIGYFIFFIESGFAFLMCSVGWGIWALVDRFRNG